MNVEFKLNKTIQIYYYEKDVQQSIYFKNATILKNSILGFASLRIHIQT